MPALKALLLNLGSNPKDRLSTLAAIVLFAGGSLATLAEAGVLTSRWGAIGVALSSIAASGIGILTGRDPHHPERGQGD
jgi:hypothetical protein